MNAIRHPNIVEIFDSGVLEDGAPYLVMEAGAQKVERQAVGAVH